MAAITASDAANLALRDTLVISDQLRQEPLPSVGNQDTRPLLRLPCGHL